MEKTAPDPAVGIGQDRGGADLQRAIGEGGRRPEGAGAVLDDADDRRIVLQRAREPFESGSIVRFRFGTIADQIETDRDRPFRGHRLEQVRKPVIGQRKTEGGLVLLGIFDHDHRLARTLPVVGEPEIGVIGFELERFEKAETAQEENQGQRQKREAGKNEKRASFHLAFFF